jgi:phenylalanyl-tRNA synthetase beta chain
VRAFEVGTLHAWHEGQPTESDVLGIILAGRDRPLAHDRGMTPLDVAAAKGLLELLVARLSAGRLVYEPTATREGVEHPGRTASVVAVSGEAAGVPIGRVGELHPSLLAAYGVRAEHVVFAQIDLASLTRLCPQRIRVGRLESLPGVERDIAVVVPPEQPAGAVEAIIHEQGGAHLHSVRLFDEYRGAPLGEGERSLAYRLRFEAQDGALGEAEVERAVERVVAVLSERLGARLRA